MTISYPLTIPSSPGPRSLKMVLQNLIGETVGEFDGMQQEQEWPGEWFECQITLPAMLRPQAEAWCAFLSALRGKLGTFLLPVYACKNPQGTSTAGNVSGANSAGSKILNVTMNGTLVAGDYIEVSDEEGSPIVSTPRLYKVLTSATGGGSPLTEVGLDIFPRLRGNLVGGETITFLNPMGLFHLIDNPRAWDVDEAQLFGITFNCKEMF